MKKSFVVEEFYGDVEDNRDQIIGICSNEEVAIALTKLSEKKNTPPDPPIKEDDWWDMQEAIDLDDDDDELVQLHKKFPKYSMKDLKQSQCYYEDYRDYKYTDYYAVDVYESEDDLKNYKTNGNNN